MNTPRDPIVADTSSSKASPKRSDTLNGAPRTKSLAGGGPNYTSNPGENCFPVPDSPYK
jgi:hypothetical protein